MSDSTPPKNQPDTSRDYHPALVRLQHNPPHPAGRRILWGLALLLGFVLAWGFWGQLDIVSVAEGRLIPTDRLKIIQPAEAGVIEAIRVREGDKVKAGQELIRLLGTETEADTQNLVGERTRLRAELERLEAQLANKPFDLSPDIPSHIASQNRARDTADRNALESDLAEEQARLNRAEKELAAAIQHKAALEATLPYYRRREQALTELLKKGGATQLQIDEEQRERIEKEHELKTQDHSIAAVRASIELSEKKINGIHARHIQRLNERQQEVSARLEQLELQIHKQQHRESRLSLRAPADGIVKQLATHTVGTVVQPGTILASLVPTDSALQAEVWLPNQDIGFIYEGQEVKLKFAAYPFQKYGLLSGTLTHLSPDAQSGEEARDAGASGMIQTALRYRGLVEIGKEPPEWDRIDHSLHPGMRVTAEIHLGTRSVAEYLLSPISQAWGKAGRER